MVAYCKKSIILGEVQMDNNEKTIDLKSIYQMLIKHIKFIILLTAVFAIFAYIISAFFISKQYTSNVMLYVQSNEQIAEQQQSGLSYNDIQVAERLANTCQTLFTSQKMTDLICEDLKNDYNVTTFSNSDIQNCITVSAVENTPILKISVTTGDPDLSAAIAQSLDLNAEGVYSSIVESGVVKEVVAAEVPTAPSSPNVSKNTVLGLVIGLVLGCAIVIVLEMIDTKVKPNDDFLAMYGIPMFAEIVDFEANVKGGYNYEPKEQ